MFRQLLDRAPTIDYGRTQVDYVDRRALAPAQDGDRKQRLVAMAMGMDTTVAHPRDFESVPLRPVFYDDDAALLAPDQYPITRNLLVATGFALQLRKEYQAPFAVRDSGRSAAYLSTQQPCTNRADPKDGPSVDSRGFEIGRSGPSLLSQPPEQSGRGAR